MTFLRMLTLSVIILLALGAFIYLKPSPAEISEYPNTWWGPGEKDPNADKSIRPFKINFPEESIEDLKFRLKNTRALTPPLEGTGWTYGTSGTFLEKNILNYWLNSYNFTSRLAYMNKFNQFTTKIQGLNIHFLHVKPADTQGKRVLPLLVCHGWPGSVMELYTLIPKLTTARPEHDFIFEVIAPSLPGFGFSSSAVRPGLGTAQIAVVLKNLMLRLGFEKFYIQAGDWGAITTAVMAALFPQHIRGAHSNMCTAHNFKATLKIILYSFWPSLWLPDEDISLMYPLSKYLPDLIAESGYFHIQATKPDTVGVGLSDSPAGLAAYILEKFSTATNRANRAKDDGGLFEKFSRDALIDNVMFYWISNSMTTSMRIYAEGISPSNLAAVQWPIHVPTGCAQFPHEIYHYPPSILQERFKNLIQVTRMPRGGHFGAMEEPKLLADDVWAFVSKIERAKLPNLSENEL